MDSNMNNSNNEDTLLTKYFKNESKKLFRNSQLNTKIVISVIMFISFPMSILLHEKIKSDYCE